MLTVNNIEDTPKYKAYTRVYGLKGGESSKAICFIYGKYGEVWLPKSQMVKVLGGILGDLYYVKKWLLKVKD